jgi:hypothetical protein
MAIQDEMYKLIEKEINQTMEARKEIRTVKIERAKEVAKMLTSLSTDTSDADTLINQYIANIKNICISQSQ